MGAAAPAIISRPKRHVPDWFEDRTKAAGSFYHPIPDILLARLSPWMGGKKHQGVACAFLFLVNRLTAGNYPDYPQWTDALTHDEIGNKLGYTREAVRDALIWIRANKLLTIEESGRSLRFSLNLEAIRELRPPDYTLAAKKTADDGGDAGRMEELPTGKSQDFVFTEPVTHTLTNKFADVSLTTVRGPGRCETVIERVVPAARGADPLLIDTIGPLFLQLYEKKLDSTHAGNIAAALNGTPPLYLLEKLAARSKRPKFHTGLWPRIAAEAAELWHQEPEHRKARYLAAGEPAGNSVSGAARADPAPPEDAEFAGPIRARLRELVTPEQYGNHFVHGRILGIDGTELILWLPDQQARQLLESETKPNILVLLGELGGAESVSICVGAP